MPRPPLLVLPFVLALVAGCGGGDDAGLIGANRADAMVRDLDEIEARVVSGDCDRAGAALARLRGRIAGLPGRTDQGLRARLDEGLTNLEGQAGRECRKATPTTTTDEDPVETVPEPVPTVPPETVPEEPEDPVQTTPEEPGEEEPGGGGDEDPGSSGGGGSDDPGGGDEVPEDSGGTIAP